MIGRLEPFLDEPRPTSGFLQRFFQYLKELPFRKVVGTRAGDKVPALRQQSHGPEVYIYVAAYGVLQVLLGLSERGRVQDYKVKLFWFFLV